LHEQAVLRDRCITVRERKSGSGVFDLVDRLRTQLALACTTIVVVIALGAATGVAALHSSARAQDTAITIDRHIVSIERLEDTAREIAASARRYMASGDQKEQQRVQALIDDMRREEAQLNARGTLYNGPALDADLDAYQLNILDAMTDFQPDPVERLTRFEDRLVRVKMPMSARFDDILEHERARRTTLRSASGLGENAEWTLVLASAIGIMLVIGVAVTVRRRLAALSRTATGVPRSMTAAGERVGDEPAVLH
jgi:hypothetical protein